MPQTRMTFHLRNASSIWACEPCRSRLLVITARSSVRMNAGEPPATPFEHGAFSVFEQAQAGVEGQG